MEAATCLVLGPWAPFCPERDGFPTVDRDEQRISIVGVQRLVGSTLPADAKQTVRMSYTRYVITLKTWYRGACVRPRNNWQYFQYMLLLKIRATFQS